MLDPKLLEPQESFEAFFGPGEYRGIYDGMRLYRYEEGPNAFWVVFKDNRAVGLFCEHLSHAYIPSEATILGEAGRFIPDEIPGLPLDCSITPSIRDTRGWSLGIDDESSVAMQRFGMVGPPVSRE